MAKKKAVKPSRRAPKGFRKPKDQGEAVACALFGVQFMPKDL
jgi:hypothetical protein